MVDFLWKLKEDVGICGGLLVVFSEKNPTRILGVFAEYSKNFKVVGICRYFSRVLRNDVHISKKILQNPTIPTGDNDMCCEKKSPPSPLAKPIANFAQPHRKLRTGSPSIFSIIYFQLHMLNFSWRFHMIILIGGASAEWSKAPLLRSAPPRKSSTPTLGS